VVGLCSFVAGQPSVVAVEESCCSLVVASCVASSVGSCLAVVEGVVARTVVVVASFALGCACLERVALGFFGRFSVGG